MIDDNRTALMMIALLVLVFVSVVLFLPGKADAGDWELPWAGIEIWH
jgi:hypothetical protein